MSKTFREQVLQVVAKIPKGDVLSYKQVATLAGNPQSSRVVGNIMNKNRNPLVPCHRVIRSDGQIGGFAFGKDMKIVKLAEEGYRPAMELLKGLKGRQKGESAIPLKDSHSNLTPSLNKYFDQNYFNRPVLEVAEDLIGSYLVKDGQKLQITEIEAYDGMEDLACHASKGRTKRTEVLFGPPGHLYVYLCYGIHWLLNVVTGPKNYPAAILIRGVGDLNGPGKLTKELNIDSTFHGKAAIPKSNLHFAPSDQRPHKSLIQRTERIGVDYAGPIWAKKPYRFVLGS